MKFKLDDNSYIEIKLNDNGDRAKLSIRTKVDRKSILVTALLEEEQVTKLISELVTVKAELYGRI